MATWRDNLQWVNDPGRTLPELRNAARSLEPQGMPPVPPNRNLIQVRSALVQFIQTKNLDEQAPVELVAFAKQPAVQQPQAAQQPAPAAQPTQQPASKTPVAKVVVAERRRRWPLFVLVAVLLLLAFTGGALMAGWKPEFQFQLPNIGQVASIVGSSANGAAATVQANYEALEQLPTLQSRLAELEQKLAATAPATAQVAAEATVTPAAATSIAALSASAEPVLNVSSWTTLDKCQWLILNFPQSTEGVQQLGARLANVQPQRIRTHLYPCSGTETVFDGLIILGPNEGYDGSFTLVVPPHGAVDSYVGATYTGNTKQIGEDTIRAFDGTVTATTATFWPWLDESPPVALAVLPTPTALATMTETATATPTAVPSTPTVVPTPVATATAVATMESACIGPDELSEQKGWVHSGSTPDQYGGLVVILTKDDELPNNWEAIGKDQTIRESDSGRSMPAGFWTIYPPFSCREALGFSK